MSNSYDIIIIGGGHAGCEASLATARRGDNTLLISIDIDKIAYMSCNPAIGGLAKGNLVKDLDALGGEMAKNIDATAIQFQVLKQTKGVASRSSRAQADKSAYSRRMRKQLFAEKNLRVLQGIVSDIVVEDKEVKGIKLLSGGYYACKKIIVATGTFLNGKIYVGDRVIDGGRMNDISSTHLVSSLNALGFEPIRLKTGTPARLDKRSIDFSNLKKYMADDYAKDGFSFETTERRKDKISCFITYTNEKTHKIVKDNVSRSLYFNSKDKALGPRYCPSMEDKVSKFADRNRHQIILEQEGEYSNEIYANGFSSSLPIDAQLKAYRTIAGLEQVEFIRPAYAIEYVAYQPTVLKPTYETKLINGLYFAGQINGTSGYEEAGVQGFMAGVNASLSIHNEAPFILGRDESYIGVMTDDLVTKGVDEPYRIFSSRAEYRLRLREDNAEDRLLEYGFRLKLISKARYDRFKNEKTIINNELTRLKSTKIKLNKESREIFSKYNIVVNEGLTCYDFIKRPEGRYNILKALQLAQEGITDKIIQKVEILIKYSGYLSMEEQAIINFRKLENITIPKDINYHLISGLRREHIERLERIAPLTLGQAMRISGITHSVIEILSVHIEKVKRSV